MNFCVMFSEDQLLKLSTISCWGEPAKVLSAAEIFFSALEFIIEIDLLRL